MRLAIVGTGLIGAFVGLAAKRGGATVVGVDADRATGFLARWIGDAAMKWRGMISEAYGDPGEVHRLCVHLPDRPGALDE